tara:strand:+ start:149 stop:289 length:141 start_codon:yes stop_codon:yes gene_type:complete
MAKISSNELGLFLVIKLSIMDVFLMFFFNDVGLCLLFQYDKKITQI